MRRLFHLIVALFAAVPANGADKPNLVFILCDDLGYGDVRCLNPAGKIPTPHFDRLAAEGMRFTDAHSSSAVCSPTRYSLMTGRYNWRSRLQSGVLGGLSPRLIEEGRLTVAQMLRDQGYHTAAIGKWHIGMDWARLPDRNVSDLNIENANQVRNVDYAQPIKNGPNAVGFDYFFGISASLDMVPYTFIENDRVTKLPTADKRFPMTLGVRGGQTRPGPAAPDFEAEDVLPTLTRRAVDYIAGRAADARAGQPFFLYVPFNAPHTPILPTKEWQGKSGISPYADFVMQTDASIGEILSALDRHGLASNTLFIATSDNGCSPQANYPQLAAAGHNPSHVFRGTKADIFDGGHRVPFIARWPGHVKAGTISEDLICLIDYMATCAAVLGVKLPAHAAEDSVSFLPALLGQNGRASREALVHHSINGSFAIRQGRWKLELCPDSGGWSAPRPGSPAAKGLPAVQLYDLAADIAETNNLQADHPEIVARLTAQLERQIADGRSTPGPSQTNTVNVRMRKSTAPANAARARPTRPNIVIMLSDDQGWGDLSVNGNANLSTPNIDSLAKSGAMLDRFYVCPVCSPTRAEFLTGRYHLRGGVRDVSKGGERLNTDERTIAEVFKAAGYATGAFGKWHNGTQGPYHPNARGFDEYYGFTSGHWGSYFDAPLDHNGALVQGQGFLADDLTEHALEFITRNQDRPFLCYVPYNTPHSPMQVPDRFWEKFAQADLKLRGREPKAEDMDFTRAALAMCENLDWNVGRVLARLDELQLADNTIVIYFSDNGPNSARWNGGMKGRKGSTDEGGVRSPFLIRWPAKIPAGKQVAEIAGAIDLLPTLADCAGVPLTGTKPLDGVSLKPLLLGTPGDWPDRMILSHWAGRTSVRTQGYRLDTTGALFDMQADPGQAHDIAARQPGIATRLTKAMADWRKELQPGIQRDDRPFTVGFPQFPTTQLPARDGLPQGQVKRSASAPNCSYFTGWTSAEDRLTWDVDVATAGRYEAALYYTCAAKDVGSTLELSLGESRLEARVTEPHDPPLRGAENDRAPRKGESYVKDFRPLHLGTIDLKSGRGPLTLRATKVAGQQVMDVRMLTLTLKP